MGTARVKRILMTADTIGGVWTYAMDLIGALQPKGIEVVLATMGAPLSAAQAQTAARLENLELRESHYKLEWMADAWKDVEEAGHWLCELAESSQPDLVHLNGYCHAALEFEVPVVVVCHSCVYSWWRALRGCEPPVHWEQYRQRVRAGLLAADLVVAPTRAIGDAILDCYATSLKARVIYNARVSTGLGPAEKQPFVLGAGRLWDEAKNLCCLDAAADQLPYPVYVAGSLQAPDGSFAQIRHARSLGSLTPERVARWMSRAAVYALPARYEPFGLSVLEAAHSGCALVLGDIPTLRELWEGAAVFVSPDDPRQLHVVLRELFERPRWLHQLATRARQRASGFSAVQFADDYSAVYQELQARSHATAQAPVRAE